MRLLGGVCDKLLSSSAPAARASLGRRRKVQSLAQKSELLENGSGTGKEERAGSRLAQAHWEGATMSSPCARTFGVKAAGSGRRPRASCSRRRSSRAAWGMAEHMFYSGR